MQRVPLAGNFQDINAISARPVEAGTVHTNIWLTNNPIALYGIENKRVPTKFSARLLLAILKTARLLPLVLLRLVLSTQKMWLTNEITAFGLGLEQATNELQSASSSDNIIVDAAALTASTTSASPAEAGVVHPTRWLTNDQTAPYCLGLKQNTYKMQSSPLPNNSQDAAAAFETKSEPPVAQAPEQVKSDAGDCSDDDDSNHKDTNSASEPPADNFLRRRVAKLIRLNSTTINAKSCGLQLIGMKTLISLHTLGSFRRRKEENGKKGEKKKKEKSANRKIHRDLLLLLEGNSLVKLPVTMFEISNLTVLNLKGNRLEKLPAAISTLRNLERET